MIKTENMKLKDLNLIPLTKETPNYSWSNKFNYMATPNASCGVEIDLSEKILNISATINDIQLAKALAYDYEIDLENESDLNYKSIELQEQLSELLQDKRDEV